MTKIIKILFVLAAISACSSDPTKNELKSPCTAVESETPAPCARTPINRSVS